MGAVLRGTIVIEEGRSRIHSVSESELEEDMEGLFSTYSWQVARKSGTRQRGSEEARQRDLFSFDARDFSMFIQ